MLEQEESMEIWCTGLALELPVTSEFRHAGQQEDNIYLWFEIETTLPKVVKFFRAYPTGIEIDLNYKTFLATVQMNNGLVFHIYEMNPGE